MIRRRLRLSLSMATVWRLLKRHGWSWQAPARRALERDEHAVELWKKETSDAVDLSSCGGEFEGWRRGESDGFVVVHALGQAVVEAAEHAVEEVALGGGVPVSIAAAAVVVGPRAPVEAVRAANGSPPVIHWPSRVIPTGITS